MSVLRRVAKLPVGTVVTARGWVDSTRKMKKVAFVDLQDGSQPLPLNVVFEDPSQASDLTTGTSVEISGTLQSSVGRQDMELLANPGSTAVKVLGVSGPDYPLQKKYHSREFLRGLPQFRWRTRQAAQVLRFRSWVLSRLQSFFTDHDVTQVNSPLLTSSDCEGAGEVFEISNSTEFFGKPVYLSVSSQLHLEIYAAALGRVWNLTPAFRAEASDTNRHLSEFSMVETELSFVNTLRELTTFCEYMVKACVPEGKAAEDLLASKRNEDARTKLQQRWSLLKGPWTSLTYTEALAELNKAAATGNVSHALEWGVGIPSEHEKYLASTIIGAPTVVTDYPSKIKPFYMKASETSAETVACFDVLLPEIGEIVGGSLREDNYEILSSRMREAKMDLETLDWYRDLRKFGSVPHGGYGLGFERLIMYVCGLDNIRDAVGFVRGAGQCMC